MRLAQALKSKDGASASPLSTSAAPRIFSQPSNSICHNTINPLSPTFYQSTSELATTYCGHASCAGRGWCFLSPPDKGKRVVEVVSDDEDSAEGQVFKRQRTQHAPQTVTSATSSTHGAESLREDPPSATSPPQPMNLEGGVETEPTGVPPPAPELPLPMQDSLRGFLGRASPVTKLKAPRGKVYITIWAPSCLAPIPGICRLELRLSNPPPFKHWKRKSPP